LHSLSCRRQERYASLDWANSRFSVRCRVNTHFQIGILVRHQLKIYRRGRAITHWHSEPFRSLSRLNQASFGTHSGGSYFTDQYPVILYLLGNLGRNQSSIQFYLSEIVAGFGGNQLAANLIPTQ
jgi:hypothetical protein